MTKTINNVAKKAKIVGQVGVLVVSATAATAALGAEVSTDKSNAGVLNNINSLGTSTDFEDNQSKNAVHISQEKIISSHTDNSPLVDLISRKIWKYRYLKKQKTDLLTNQEQNDLTNSLTEIK